MQLQTAMQSNQPVSTARRPHAPLERISDCILQSIALPQRPALSDCSGSWTYAQLADITSNIESWLIYLGIRAGDRVMIVSENCRLFVAAWFALSRIDARPVLVTAGISPQEFDQLLPALPPVRREFYVSNGSRNVNLQATRQGARLLNPIDWGPIAIGALNERAEPEPLEGGIASRVAAEVYWHDRTGQLRSEEFTHRNLLFVAAACARMSDPSRPVHCTSPISDIFGLSGVLLPALLTGGTVHLSSQLNRVADFHLSIH